MAYEEANPPTMAGVDIDYEPATHLIYQEGTTSYKSPGKDYGDDTSRGYDQIASKTTAMHTIGGHSLNLHDSGMKNY